MSKKSSLTYTQREQILNARQALPDSKFKQWVQKSFPNLHQVTFDDPNLDIWEITVPIAKRNNMMHKFKIPIKDLANQKELEQLVGVDKRFGKKILAQKLTKQSTNQVPTSSDLEKMLEEKWSQDLLKQKDKLKKIKLYEEYVGRKLTAEEFKTLIEE